MKYAKYVEPKKNKDLIGTISSIVLLVAFLVLAFFVGVMFYCNVALGYYPISGTSMQPLINASGLNTDYVYATYDVSNVTYGDVIIFHHPDATQASGYRQVIKRVIALGGDNVMIKNTFRLVENTDQTYYALYIQYGGEGEFVEVDEDYVIDKTSYRSLYFGDFYVDDDHDKTFLFDEYGNPYIHLEEGQIFYAGDNRLNSNDCFDYGPQEVSNIVAEVRYIIYGGTNRIWQVILQMLGIYKWN